MAYKYDLDHIHVVEVIVVSMLGPCVLLYGCVATNAVAKRKIQKLLFVKESSSLLKNHIGIHSLEILAKSVLARRQHKKMIMMVFASGIELQVDAGYFWAAHCHPIKSMI